MNRDMKVSVVGGDRRYFWVAEELKSLGLSVETFGVPEKEDSSNTLREALEEAGLVLLPMRPLVDGKLTVRGETVEAVMLPELLKPGAVLAAGQLPTKLEAWLSEQGLSCFEYLEQEKYLLQNAYITAEGALGLLLGEMERTIRGSRILITGWGRIGKLLAGMLRALGAEVTVGVRRDGQKVQLEMLGYPVEILGQYRGKYHAVVNTVPAVIFEEKQLRDVMEKDCVLVELASLPGGFPPVLDLPVVDGRALPGRTAPRTAGKYLAEAIMAFYHGEGRNLE